MADITSAEAIAYASQIRSAAEQIAALYRTAKMLDLTWHARNYGVLFPVAEDVVADNRVPQITSNDVVGIIVQLEAFINDLEANNKGKLNVILQMASNL